MSGGRTARSDLIGGAGWMVFGLAILAESLRMERFSEQGAQLYTVPGFVPGVLGSVLLFLGLVLVLRGWRRSLREAGPAASPPLLNRRVALALPLALLYAAGLIGRLPFWLATSLFLAAFIFVFAPPEQSLRQRAWRALLCAAAATALVFFVFQELFLVRLP